VIAHARPTKSSSLCSSGCKQNALRQFASPTHPHDYESVIDMHQPAPTLVRCDRLNEQQRTKPFIVLDFCALAQL